MKNNTRSLCLSALFIALILVATLIYIPIVYGYVNLGDGFVIISGFILGPYNGMIVSAFGSAFADALLGYNQYIIPTFLLKGFLGIFCWICR